MGCHRNKEKEGSPLFFYCHDRPPALSHYFRCSEKSFPSPFSSSFAKPFMGNTVHLSAIRCFPFLAVKHAPSYRQRKRSLDFARDDDTRNAPFPLSAIRCFPSLVVRRSPSYRQRKRSLGSASDDDTGNVLFPHILCMMHGIAIPHAVISSVARNLFRPPFPSSFAKPSAGSTVPPFLRYGVSRSSPSNTLRLTANEKDPSTSLGMTIRETRLFHFPRYGASRFLLSDMHHTPKEAL